jgi:glycosyltransferase involved in cell wall biosynthesis
VRASGVPLHVRPFPGLRRLSSVRAIASLASLMRRERIDIVQAYGFYSNVPAILAARLAGVPVGVASRRDMGEFHTPFTRLIERAIFSLAHRVVVNAQAIRGQLVTSRQVRAEKITVIANGVDLDRFDGAGPAFAVPWAAGGKVVGMIAQFRRAKDHRTFLLAAQRVRAVEPAAVFVLVGDGYLRPPAEQLSRDLGIAPVVFFLGAAAPDAVPAILREFDVSVLVSTRYEGLPNAILEAMGAGKPVVATDVGGCREAVVEGATGFLVPRADPAALANRILHILGDPHLAGRLGRAGRERAVREFSMPAMLHRFTAFYNALAADRPPAVPEPAG